jgi:type III restriction enzyme
MSNAVINPSALEPLFGPSDLPDRYRVRSDTPGAQAKIINGRRPSKILIAQTLRHAVADWRAAEYPYAGASDTSRELLLYWFGCDHEIQGAEGQRTPFSYYFCQREAIETLIFLYEVRGIRSLSALTANFGGADAERLALGIDPESDLWAKYAFKIATGAGKTKVMSLAIVWSYFHALRESDSPMTRHFVIIAPGVTVFERLKEDFADGRIFDRDPLIPPEWRGDWNMSVVLQDEASGAPSGGTIYLTNIHRLYENRRSRQEPETYEFMGPAISKGNALDTAKVLRDRVTAHPRLMVVNDEAHHVWDPDSSWNDAIDFLHSTTSKRGGGLVAQLDFSATPRDNMGNIFQHVVCDTPLGEAVDGGIVKTPIIGSGGALQERADNDAGFRYENHLTLAYNRWLASKQEWERSGKKTLLFVMTENTKAANEIARRLNNDLIYRELNGKTVNLHTNLKGKLKKIGRGANAYDVFIESEKEISDEDLKALRKLSRELDDNTSPYRCIVSVLMLREGWDIRNVTTIIPLRPLSAKSRILPQPSPESSLSRPWAGAFAA